ncbi:hypothetical protein VNO78_12092 [Psophocarpus tetragonolobus]|uniref:Uncharacterized protein n=1 Tax=Psophocarpus tetragonolobus TaxID=3891 RepID=A0AAN9SQ45_PSOTE
MPGSQRKPKARSGKAKLRAEKFHQKKHIFEQNAAILLPNCSSTHPTEQKSFHQNQIEAKVSALVEKSRELKTQNPTARAIYKQESTLIWKKMNDESEDHYRIIDA